MPYHTNEQLQAELERLATGAPGRAVLRSIGTTREGRPIPALTLTAAGAPDPAGRPQALITANVHGNEVIASEVALHLAGMLAAGERSGEAGALLEQADVTVVPAVNLDARAPAAAALSEGRWARTSRGNGRGVDLNRNFPLSPGARDVWHPLAGTRYSFLPWYRGPHALSEPESQALAGLAEQLRPRAALNLHSVGELFLYPYCCSTRPPAHEESFRAMGRAFTGAQGARPYKVKQSRSWYAILGDMDDWLYDTFGTLSVTVEVARPLAGVEGRPGRLFTSLAWMNPRSPEPTIEHTARPCLLALAEGIRCFECGPERPSS